MSFHAHTFIAKKEFRFRLAEEAFNKVHNMNEFDFLYMQKDPILHDPKGEMFFLGICMIRGIFNLNIVDALLWLQGDMNIKCSGGIDTILVTL